MKKFLALAVGAVLVIALTGCNLVANKVGEKIAEGALGGNVDINGDKITVEGDDGTKMTIGDTKWPSSDLAKKIPEFKKGKITYVLDAETGVMVSLEEVAEADFNAYLEEVKKTYAKNTFAGDTDDGYTYAASNEDGSITVSLMFGKADKTLVISMSKQEKSE